MILFHTGFEEIREPDIHYGRKNADFGQGFYLTADRAFAERWTKKQSSRSFSRLRLRKSFPENRPLKGLFKGFFIKIFLTLLQVLIKLKAVKSLTR